MAAAPCACYSEAACKLDDLNLQVRVRNTFVELADVSSDDQMGRQRSFSEPGFGGTMSKATLLTDDCDMSTNAPSDSEDDAVSTPCTLMPAPAPAMPAAEGSPRKHVSFAEAPMMPPPMLPPSVGYHLENAGLASSAAAPQRCWLPLAAVQNPQPYLCHSPFAAESRIHCIPDGPIQERVLSTSPRKRITQASQCMLDSQSQERMLSMSPRKRNVHASSVAGWQAGEASPMRAMASTPTTPSKFGESFDGQKTTVMLRNLPASFLRSNLVEVLEDEGLAGCFDLVYVPVDFARQVCLGYAFVNLRSASDVVRCWRIFDGFSAWGCSSDRVCEVAWVEPCQGLHAHIERYRNSPVMHKSVPDEWKPQIFMDGMPVPFPAPTKFIKAPRFRPRANVTSDKFSSA